MSGSQRDPFTIDSDDEDAESEGWGEDEDTGEEHEQEYASNSQIQPKQEPNSSAQIQPKQESKGSAYPPYLPGFDDTACTSYHGPPPPLPFDPRPTLVPGDPRAWWVDPVLLHREPSRITAVRLAGIAERLRREYEGRFRDDALHSGRIHDDALNNSAQQVYDEILRTEAYGICFSGRLALDETLQVRIGTIEYGDEYKVMDYVERKLAELNAEHAVLQEKIDQEDKALIEVTNQQQDILQDDLASVNGRSRGFSIDTQSRDRSLNAREKRINDRIKQLTKERSRAQAGITVAGRALVLLVEERERMAEEKKQTESKAAKRRLEESANWFSSAFDSSLRISGSESKRMSQSGISTHNRQYRLQMAASSSSSSSALTSSGQVQNAASKVDPIPNPFAFTGLPSSSSVAPWSNLSPVASWSSFGVLPGSVKPESSGAPFGASGLNATGNAWPMHSQNGTLVPAGNESDATKRFKPEPVIPVDMRVSSVSGLDLDLVPIETSLRAQSKRKTTEDKTPTSQPTEIKTSPIKPLQVSEMDQPEIDEEEDAIPQKQMRPESGSMSQTVAQRLTIPQPQPATSSQTVVPRQVPVGANPVAQPVKRRITPINSANPPTR